jgi:PAS domain S-box-containing protein
MSKLENSQISVETIRQEIIMLCVLFLIVSILSAIFNGFGLLVQWVSSSGSYFLKNYLVGMIALSFGLLYFSIKRYFHLYNEINTRMQFQSNYERYRQYTEGISKDISEMVFILDHEMKIKFLNKPALVRNPNAKGKFFYDTFPNFNYKSIEQYFQQAFRSKETQKGVIREKPKEDIHGGIKWNLTAVPILDSDGDTEDVVMIISFISEIESNRPFRQLLESYVTDTDEAMILLDSDKKIQFMNKAAEKLYGYRSIELITSPIKKLASDITAQSFNTISLNTYDTKREVRTARNNEKKWVSYSRIPLNNREGALSGYMDVSRDITHIVESEEEQKYRAKVMENIPISLDIPYCFIDDSSKVVSCDNQFFDITGIKEGEFIRTFPGELVLGINRKQSKYFFKSKKISNKLLQLSGTLIYGFIQDIKDDSTNLSVLESYLRSAGKVCFLESENDGIIFVSDRLKDMIKEIGVADPEMLLNKLSTSKTNILTSNLRFYQNAAIDSQMNLSGDLENYKIRNIVFTENKVKYRIVLFDHIEKIKPEQPRIIEDYKKIYDSLDFGISVMRKDSISNSFKIVQVNQHIKNVEKNFNMKILNENMESVVPVRKYSEQFRLLSKVLRTGEAINYEVLFKDKDGKPLKWQIHHVFKLNNDHVTLAMIDIDKPLKERKELKEEVSYRSYLHSFNGIAYRLDLNLKPIFYIGAVMGITGYSQNDLTNEKVKWTQLIHKDDIEGYLEYRRKVIVMTGNEYNFEYRIINKNGDELWISEHIQSTTNEKGVISHIDGTIYDITQRKKAEIELKESRRVLRALTEHFESVREAEKKELAHEIHDDLGHALTVLKLDLAWVQNKKFLREDTLQERVLDMSRQIDQIIKKVRYISTELRPSILDHFGIIAAIEWKASEFQKRTAIRCRLSIEPTNIDMDEHTSTVVFRIFQETLTNAARHSNASRIDITLFIEKDVFNLSVSDNGVGMKQESINNNKSLGLIGIKERAKFIGGEVIINSVVNYGATITLKLPLKKQKIL